MDKVGWKDDPSFPPDLFPFHPIQVAIEHQVTHAVVISHLEPWIPCRLGKAREESLIFCVPLNVVNLFGQFHQTFLYYHTLGYIYIYIYNYYYAFHNFICIITGYIVIMMPAFPSIGGHDKPIVVSELTKSLFGWVWGSPLFFVKKKQLAWI